MTHMNPTAGRALIAAFERSSKRVMKFCEDQGVSYAVLKYWRNRIAELDEQQSSGFVQVETKQSPDQESNAAAMAILPNGVRIAFQKSHDVTIGVIEALARC